MLENIQNSGLPVQNKLIELTEEVERECPVAKQLGHSGIGEGIVWTLFWQGNKYIMKIKGSLHSTSKTTQLASVDTEVLNSIYEFIDYAATENRINQGITETGAKEKKDIPDLLRWVANDIIKEETDTLVANGLEWKQVAKGVSDKVRRHFFGIVDAV